MNSLTIDMNAVKRGQQQMWASGDYGAVAAMIHLVAERLVESVDPAAGSRVLDVAGSAERLDILFEPADAEALPYADASYDVVLSVFGAMFAPDQETTAAELLRVTRPGGQIGLAAWTPDGFLGQWFRAQGAHVAPPAGLASPLRWGSEEGVAELLGDRVSSLRTRKRVFTWRFADAEAMVQMFRELYGPTVRAFAVVGEDGADALERDLLAVVEQCAEPRENAIAVPATYLEVVAVKR
jgi:SAM-dependent methyltransferase